MNWLHAFVAGVLCDRATLLTRPWLMFFRAPVTPAEPWSFRTGSITSLLTRRVTKSPRCDRKFRSSFGSAPWETRFISMYSSGS